MARLKHFLRQMGFMVIPRACVLAQKILAKTFKVKSLGAPMEGPYILAIWHTNAFFAPYFHRDKKLRVLVSQSKDGELITRVMESYGHKAIRGSTHKKGVAALKQMIRTLRDQKVVAITPDGPRGPIFKVREGLIVAASAARVPIIPFHFEASHQWVLKKTWDQHRIPKPFSKVTLSYGQPIYVDKDLTAEKMAEKVLEVEKAMQQNMWQAALSASQHKRPGSIGYH